MFNGVYCLTVSPNRLIHEMLTSGKTKYRRGPSSVITPRVAIFGRKVEDFKVLLEALLDPSFENKFISKFPRCLGTPFDLEAYSGDFPLKVGYYD